jgi:hypothetical protein
MTADRTLDRLAVRRIHGGFALESPELYCWDEDPREVIDTAEAVHPAHQCGREREIHYTIDPDDRISGVGGAWSEFARRNEAPELEPEAVVGRHIWDFIQGKEVQRLYQDVMHQVRHRGKQVEIPARCDSPTHARWTRQTLAPGERGAILQRSIIVHETYRVFAPILDRTLRRGASTLPICDFCNGCLLDSRWIALEDVLARLGSDDPDELPQLQRSVCRRCADALRAACARPLDAPAENDRAACVDPRDRPRAAPPMQSSIVIPPLCSAKPRSEVTAGSLVAALQLCCTEEVSMAKSIDWYYHRKG